MQNYSVTSASQKKLDMENKAEHNLQNRSQTNQPSNMNNEETYNILTIINGRLSGEETSWIVQQRTA